jgi:hypothetical protein
MEEARSMQFVTVSAISSSCVKMLNHKAWYATRETGPIPCTIANASIVLVENIVIGQSPCWHNFTSSSINVTFNKVNLRSVAANSTQVSKTSQSSQVPWKLLLA